MRDADSFDAFYASSVRRITGQVYAMIGRRVQGRRMPIRMLQRADRRSMEN